MAEVPVQHLLLLVRYDGDRPMREPVHVAPVAGGRYRLLHSPGFVQGVAAGDELRLVDDDGAFEVVRRGGNIAVQVFSPDPVAAHRAELAALAARAGGVLDGAIDRGMVFTFPGSVGFEVIGRTFDGWVRSQPGWEWYYGNVYDPVDGVTPLDWWQDRPEQT